MFRCLNTVFGQSYTNNKNNAVMYKQKDAVGLLKCNKNLMFENAG